MGIYSLLTIVLLLLHESNQGLILLSVIGSNNALLVLESTSTGPFGTKGTWVPAMGPRAHTLTQNMHFLAK
jgi:hypothetical protein